MNLSKEIVEIPHYETDSELLTELYQCAHACFQLQNGQSYSRAVHDEWFNSEQRYQRKVLIYRDSDKSNMIVGFAARFRLIIKLNGKKHILYRGLACFLDQYRGGSRVMAFILSQAIKDRIFMPLVSISYIDSLDLSSYALFAKYAHQVYPSCEQPISSEQLSFLHIGAKAMGIPVCDKSPFVTPSEIITTQSKNIRRENGISRYFYSLVPECDTKGDGLLAYIPVTFTNILFTTVRYFYFNLVKKLKGVKRLSKCDVCRKKKCCSFNIN